MSVDFLSSLFLPDRSFLSMAEVSKTSLEAQLVSPNSSMFSADLTLCTKQANEYVIVPVFSVDNPWQNFPAPPAEKFGRWEKNPVLFKICIFEGIWLGWWKFAQSQTFYYRLQCGWWRYFI